MLTGLLGLISSLAGAIAPGELIPLSLQPGVPSAPLQLSQSLIGQCRQLQRIERIYSAGDLAADRISDLPAGTRITLASEVNQPSVGWVRISYPVTGYIQTAFLIPCGSPPAAPATTRSTPQTTPTPPTCGVVLPPLLTIRSGPATTFAALQDLTQADTFRVIGSPQAQTQPPTEQGRIWVQIERAGITGWVAETGPQGIGTNLQRVSCSTVQVP